jgi:hypothetical protein
MLFMTALPKTTSGPHTYAKTGPKGLGLMQVPVSQFPVTGTFVAYDTDAPRPLSVA